MIPAVWTFLNVLNESNFNRDARNFVSNELKALPHFEYLKKNATYTYNGRNDVSEIELNTFGLDEIPESTYSLLQTRMKDYPALGDCKLIINQNRSKNLDNIRYMEELRTRDSLDLLSQSEQIRYLENKVKQLSKLERQYIAFDELIKEVHVNYEHIDQFSYANVIHSNFTKTDTVSVFSVQWQNDLKEADKLKDKGKLEAWLKLKLKLDTLVVKSVN